jgi:hypothetical protein
MGYRRKHKFTHCLLPIAYSPTKLFHASQVSAPSLGN